MSLVEVLSVVHDLNAGTNVLQVFGTDTYKGTSV